MKKKRLVASVQKFGRYLHVTLLATLSTYCLEALLQFSGAAHVDQISWRLLASVALPLVSTSASSDVAVLLIGDEYFEKEFQQSSPLNRREVARILRGVEATLVRERSPTVAVDFDLSPVANPDESQSRAQADLDETLLSLSKRARVILICPFARTKDLRALQLTWAESLASRARAGASGNRSIQFALPDLQVQAGAVLNYNPDKQSLGVLAGQAMQKQVQADSSASAAEPCTAAPNNELDAVPSRKINFAGYGAHSTLELTSSTPLSEMLSMWQPRLVMIGGSYSLSTDEFGTATGERLRGVELHTAVAYSVQHPIGRLPKLAEPVFKFAVVGLVLKLGKRLVHWIFEHMRPQVQKIPAGRGLRQTAHWMWATAATDDSLLAAELWTRWLIGLILLGASFLLFVLGLGLISIGLMLVSGYWYDFLLAAFVAFGKNVSGEVKGLLEQLGVSRETPSKEPATAEQRRRLRVAGRATVTTSFLIRSAVLAGGAAFLLSKVFE